MFLSYRLSFRDPITSYSSSSRAEEQTGRGPTSFQISKRSPTVQKFENHRVGVIARQSVNLGSITSSSYIKDFANQLSLLI